MGTGRKRFEWLTGPGRSELGPRRPAMPADGGFDPWDDQGFDEDGGSAGVREPRWPKPSGPLAGAGELPAPESPTYLVLSDPRR